MIVGVSKINYEPTAPFVVVVETDEPTEETDATEETTEDTGTETVTDETVTDADATETEATEEDASAVEEEEPEEVVALNVISGVTTFLLVADEDEVCTNS